MFLEFFKKYFGSWNLVDNIDHFRSQKIADPKAERILGWQWYPSQLCLRKPITSIMVLCRGLVSPSTEHSDDKTQECSDPRLEHWGGGEHQISEGCSRPELAWLRPVKEKARFSAQLKEHKLPCNQLIHPGLLGCSKD